MKTILLITLILSAQIQASDISGLLGEIQDLVNLSDRVKALEESSKDAPKINPYEFILKDKDGNGYVDTEWEEIIAQGQAIQAPYWDESEKAWTDARGPSPSGVGWYGTAESPIITILCTDPVYKFQNTARLPGRFAIKAATRWNSFMRFEATGDKLLIDDNAWGTQTNAPIGIYVEPSTVVNGRAIRNFEQTIEGVMIIGQNGTMPIYISENAFNFQVSNCNIQAHQGAKIVIKHGPLLVADWYPVTQERSNVYLPDPKFINVQIEGRHRAERKACGILISGNNMIFQNLNFYGLLHGIYAHGGSNRVVNGCALHTGNTSTGQQWANPNEFILCLLSYRDGQPDDAITGNAGAGKQLRMIKRSRMPYAAGWHLAGDATL